MQYFFEPSGQLDKDRKIKNTDFEKFYPNVNNNLSHDVIAPYIKNATHDFVLKYVSQEQYDVLVTYDNTTPVPLYDTILQHLKTAIANYAVYLAIPSLSGKISDMGVVENSNDNTAPASMWRTKSMRWEAMKQADTAMDHVLTVLEKHQDDARLQPWKDSDAYKLAGTARFRTSTELAQHLNIRGRRAFIALMPYLKKAEIALRKIVCSEYMTSLDESNDNIIGLYQEYCNNYIAEKAMLLGAPHLSMIYDGTGYMLASSTDSFDNRNNAVEQHGPDAIARLERSLIESTAETEKDIVRMLHNNPDTFTDWAAEHEDGPMSGGIVTSSCGKTAMF